MPFVHAVQEKTPDERQAAGPLTYYTWHDDYDTFGKRGETPRKPGVLEWLEVVDVAMPTTYCVLYVLHVIFTSFD